MKVFVRPLKVIVLTLITYLLDVCVMNHMSIGYVSASACWAGIAVITVSYGKKAAFCSGCIIGILMDTMMSSIPILYLLSYPIISVLCAQWFADLSDRQRERRKLSVAMDSADKMTSRFRALYANKILNGFKAVVRLFRRNDNMNPYLRIPLCAFVQALLFNTVLMVYGYISDFGLQGQHIIRALISSVYTSAVSLVLMLPYRKYLGLLGGNRKRITADGGESI